VNAKTKAVVSDVVQGQRRVLDAIVGAALLERAVWAHRAARQAAGKACLEWTCPTTAT